jgi:hypothetical protein
LCPSSFFTSRYHGDAAKRRESEDPPKRFKGCREGRKKEGERRGRKKGRTAIKREGDIDDPRIHRRGQTAWSLFHGALMHQQTNRLASTER